MDRYLEHAIKCLEEKRGKAQDEGFCVVTVAEIDMYLNIIKEFREALESAKTKCDINYNVFEKIFND